MHGAPAALAASIAELQLLERGLRLDDDRVGAAVDEGLGLLVERVAHLRLGEVAVGLHQAAERADVAEHVAGLAAERLARDRDRGLVHLGDVAGVAVAVQHDPRPAEGVGDDAVRARLGVAALDAEHLVGVRQVPGLAAAALFEAGQHELRAHGAVADQRARP